MKKKPIEIHINTRGCKKPLDKKTARIIADVMIKLHKRYSKELSDGKPLR